LIRAAITEKEKPPIPIKPFLALINLKEGESAYCNCQLFFGFAPTAYRLPPIAINLEP